MKLQQRKIMNTWLSQYVCIDQTFWTINWITLLACGALLCTCTVPVFLSDLLCLQTPFWWGHRVAGSWGIQWWPLLSACPEHLWWCPLSYKPQQLPGPGGREIRRKAYVGRKGDREGGGERGRGREREGEREGGKKGEREKRKRERGEEEREEIIKGRRERGEGGKEGRRNQHTENYQFHLENHYQHCNIGTS